MKLAKYKRYLELAKRNRFGHQVARLEAERWLNRFGHQDGYVFGMPYWVLPIGFNAHDPALFEYPERLMEICQRISGVEPTVAPRSEK